MKLSPSSVNLFLGENFGCPRKWFYVRNKAPSLPIDKRKMELGISIHNIIKEYYSKISDNPSKKEIKLTAMDVFDDGYNEIIREFYSEAEDMIRNFIDIEISRLSWKRYKPELVEGFLETESLKGVIDFFGSETIIDWKTGTAPWTLSRDILRQGNIYRILLQKNGYKVKKIIFIYLKEREIKQIPFDDSILEDIRVMRKMIEKGEFPKNERACPFCEFVLLCECDKLCLWRKI